MKEPLIAKRYAEGFLSYCRDTIGFEQGLEELRKFKHLLLESPELMHFLQSFEIGFIEKSDFIDRVLGKIFREEFIHFLKLLLEKNRIRNLEGAADYAIHAYLHAGEQEAVLKTAFMLDSAMIREIKEGLERKLKRKVRLYLDFDPELLGGFQLNVGNIVIDGSLRRALGDLREKLRNVKVN
jgi:F-type H+-transporting ATPase subunit delta